jgi:peptidoglycan/LPS O-acetylase OafA/YrhL
VRANRIHIDNLDCIRGICLLYVLITHLFGLLEITDHNHISSQIRNLSHFGSFGVTGFFTLSAFLLTNILLKEKNEIKKIGIKNFYFRRILRIMPLYLTSIALVYIIDQKINGSSNIHLFGLLSFTENWFAFRNSVNNPLVHLWSICVEVQFYILLPLIISLRKFFLNLICVCAIVIAILSRFFISTHFSYPAVWNFSSSHMDAIFLGVFLSLNIQKIQKVICKIKYLVILHFVNFLVIIMWCFYAFPSVYASQWSSMSYFFVSMNFAILIIAAIKSEWRFKGKYILVYLGKRSYGAYVIHYPLVILFFVTENKTSLDLGDLVIIIGILLIAAELSFRYLEQPFLRARRKFQAIQTD